jgi:hypothetical protein
LNPFNFVGVGQGYFDDFPDDDVTNEIQADESVQVDESALMDELVPVDELTDESVSMDKLTNNESGPTDKLADEVDESAPTGESARLDAVQQALKKSDAFSLIKPRLDQLAGLTGKDP